MEEAADARDVAQLIHPLFQDAAHKDITGEKWLDPAHNASLGGSFEPKSGMKNLQTQIFAHIRRSDVLMFGLGSRTIPSWSKNLHS